MLLLTHASRIKSIMRRYLRPAAGHGLYLYSKLFSRLNFSSGKLYCENGTGLRPSSEVTRVLSNTVFHTR